MHTPYMYYVLSRVMTTITQSDHQRLQVARSHIRIYNTSDSRTDRCTMLRGKRVDANRIISSDLAEFGDDKTFDRISCYYSFNF